LDVMKLVGYRWKHLTPEEKNEFEGKAREDKKRYDKEIDDFNKEINKVNITTVDEKKNRVSNIF
jgi:hypothetical protein